MLEISDAMLRYFDARDAQHDREIKAALPELEEQMRGFLGEHRDDPNLPVFLARMIRETAVIAASRGRWYAGGGTGDAPKDSVVLWDTLHYVREFPDLCPAWRIFDGRDAEADDAEA